MENLVNLEFACLSDTGQVRSGNEDATALAPELGAAILADGMGGYNAGEIASGMACALLKNELETTLNASLQSAVSHEALQQAVSRTNDAIVQLANSQAQYAGMGTTLVVALFHDKHITVAHMGDSRLYLLRGKRLRQVTSDHSVLQAQIDAGILTPEQARLSQNKNLVTRALGVETSAQAEIHTYATEAGDLYLLCSDGLSDMVDDEHIEAMLNDYGHQLPLCVDQLIACANLNGGRDNVTAILVKVLGYTPVSRNPVTRFLNWLK